MNMQKRRPLGAGAFLCTAQKSFNPQSLRDSPSGALGTVFPKPLASLRSEVSVFLGFGSMCGTTYIHFTFWTALHVLGRGFFGGIVGKIYVSYDSYMFLCGLYRLE